MTKGKFFLALAIGVVVVTRKEVRAAVPAANTFAKAFSDFFAGYPSAKSAVDDLIGTGVDPISASPPGWGTPAQQNIGWLDAAPPNSYANNPNLPSGSLPLYRANSPADWSFQ